MKAKSIAGITRPSDRELLRRAVTYAVNDTKRRTERWILVRNLFHIGSTTAIALCREFDLDPGEELI